jgi:hypothetical protein
MRPEKHPLGMAHETIAKMSHTKKPTDGGPSEVKVQGTWLPLGSAASGKAYCLIR